MLSQFIGKKDVNLTPNRQNLKLYDGGKIKSIGDIEVSCTRRGKFHLIKFLVVKENVVPVIGCKDSQRLSLLKVLQNDGE